MKKILGLSTLIAISIIAIRSQQSEKISRQTEPAPQSIAATKAMPVKSEVNQASETYVEASDLFSEIEGGNWKRLEEYLRAGGDPNVRDPQGRAFLHWAALQGRGDMIHLLLSSGANIDAQDQEGVTALMLATGQSQLESLEQLLAAGADLFKENEIGQTALLLAVEASSSEGFDQLIKAGADLHDRFGEAELDAYHLASSNRDTRMMDQLIKADPSFVHSQDA
ncbi:MAG: ankyrin repeat domain-containing protein, partial [Methylococcales bacterium]|nr:ankyrin repeat domain-containing protein [Methylococcales bacterium]